ncbi:ribonuclease III domain-containing protein [Thermoanaerobacterium sp. RBIITD]|uniref:Mini-ribonuclease 3 n=1 Tax=Thermoanaerobacterium sp. RBIITD TaxID=1550240 RepID=UPI000BB9B523|nr:ribonuclease III domain-containing protein [Thermoanaerobacterium sp. RBIITD]SNX54350.1 ribonuclease-3 family protein [Thermoanaerobacterium sp. RBIITD]
MDISNIDNIVLKKQEVMNLSPLIMAFVGDSVYDLFIRTHIAVKGNRPINKIHRECVKYVKAESQSKILKTIYDIFDDEEKDIIRRGRNVKSATVPKHAGIDEYRLATAFEALIGYLYLLGRYDRLNEILKMCIKYNINEG